ncbi:MAG: hypothetical protein ACLRZ6_02280 [Lachnospiraceae bacterium]
MSMLHFSHNLSLMMLCLAKQLNADMKVLTADVLSNETVVKNPSDCCYHCKNVIFNMILAEAKKDGFTVLMDGTNASDAEDDRPGMRALRELCVYSPLRICGLTKTEIEDVQKKQVFLHGISQLMPVWQHVSQQTSASLQKSLKRRKKQKIICSLLALQIFVCVI